MAFLVIGFQRSGTGMLTSALNQHPEIWCEDEIELPDQFKKILKNESRMPHGFEPLKGGRCYERYYNEKKFGPVRVLGANIKYFALDRLLRKDKDILKSFKIIHLKRANVLYTILSIIINRDKEKYGIRAHEYSPVKRKEKVLLEEKHIKQIKELKDLIPKKQIYWNGYFLKTHGPKKILDLYYEDIIGIDHSPLICNFLKVKHIPLKPITIKTGEAIKDMVKNPEILKDYL